MIRAVRRRALLTLGLCLIAVSLSGQTQTATQPYEPAVGQAGKDVVWVPTSDLLVEQMLDLARVTAKDYVIDLGSGDGRTVIAAARRGARAMGIEYNPDMVELSKRNAAAAGVQATFLQADLFATDFTQATVITMFLLPEINLKLRPQILDLRPGTRVVSNTFTMGDWEADETGTVTEDCTNWCTALLWIVPAKVEGTWRLSDGDLTLTQRFQTISGSLGPTAISNGWVRGTEITFTAGNTEYTGIVNGTSIQGTTSGGGTGKWSATRR